MRLALVTVVFASLALSQGSPDEKLQFEVVSIKPTVREPGRGLMMRVEGGPGQGDPTRIRYQNLSLHNLITIAYGIEYYQLIGADELMRVNYVVDARMPEGTTKEQLKFMMGNMLIERFKLAAHREQREMPESFVTVARNGKMKEHVEQPAPAAAETPKDGVRKMQKDAEGYPILDGPGMWIMGDRARWRVEKASMPIILSQISSQLGHPVKDETGLTGEYDFTLSWVPGNNPDAAGPDFVTALREQLGLRVDTKKAMTEVIVLDHIEKTPTDN